MDDHRPNVAIDPEGGPALRPGTKLGLRYEVTAPLGRGGMGSVFTGRDLQLERVVAIKILPVGLSGSLRAREGILTEGRAMARIRHPACVQVFDQGIDEVHGPYLIMERLEGMDLAQFLSSQGTLSVPQALGLIEQLCAAVVAAHDAGIVHRDLKPANVFVLRHVPGAVPAVKLLDFGIAGLVVGNDDDAVPADIQGTLAYMAPERLQNREADIRGDVYSLGAILLESISGCRPFRADSFAELRLAILNDRPISFQALPGDIPGWLVSVIERAMDKSPEKRFANVRALGRALGLVPPSVSMDELSFLEGRGGSAEWSRSPSPDSTFGAQRSPEMPLATLGSPSPPDAFVGRLSDLAALEDFVGRLATGSPQVVWIEGTSGIGKTALLAAFRRRLTQKHRALVLSCRSHEGLSVPFPVLNQALEELSAHLLSLPTTVSARLLPRRVEALTRIFPVMNRVPGFSHSGEPDHRAPSGTNERRQAFEALRELLARLCDRQPVVLMIDDAQWIDSDSRSLLSTLLNGSDAPAILVVGTVRATEEWEDWARAIDSLVPTPAYRLHLGPLSASDCGDLLRARWQGASPLTPDLSDSLAEECRGIPFFAEILASAGDLTPASGDRANVNTDAVLDRVLASRLKSLAAPSRRALELTCVASRALRTRVLLKLSGTEDAGALESLFSGPFVRSVPTEHGWSIEPYHGRIRDVIVSGIDPDELRAYHKQIASVLREDPSYDPEFLVEHLAKGNEGVAAAAVALSAAATANGQLAFDRAAALFRVALTHGFFPPATRIQILQEGARALFSAGRRKEAGEWLLQAADLSADPTNRAHFRRAGATHLLLAGDIQNALTLLKSDLDLAGLTIPSGLAETINVTLATLEKIGQKGLSRPPVPFDGAPINLERIDLWLVLAQGLAHIDLRSLPFACWALWKALEGGDIRRVQRACALFVVNCVEYVPNPLVAPALELCRQLTDEIGEPYERALFDAAVAENAHFEGNFLAAEAAFERAERTLLRSCPDATRELAAVRDLAVFVQYAQKGDFKTQLSRTQRWLAQAEAAHDVYHASMLRVAHAIVWIAHDQPERARAELNRAKSEWLGEAGVLEVGAALYHAIVDRYEERDRDADTWNRAGDALISNPAAKTPFLSGYIALQSSWKALRTIANGRLPSSERENLIADLHAAIEHWRNLTLPLWSAVSEAMEGNLNYLVGRTEQAMRNLDESEQQFRRLSMLCLAACARKRRGQFTSGHLGARLEGEADAELRALGVVNPARWTRAYWSMFDADSASIQTVDL